MWRSKRFWKGYLVYTAIVYTIVFVLVFLMGASFSDVGTDGSGLIRANSFLVRNVFGFPINLFLVDDLGGLGKFIIAIIALPVNCFIQFSVIYFVTTRIRANERE
jgi:hypothetical protein